MDSPTREASLFGLDNGLQHQQLTRFHKVASKIHPKHNRRGLNLTRAAVLW